MTLIQELIIEVGPNGPPTDESRARARELYAASKAKLDKHGHKSAFNTEQAAFRKKQLKALRDSQINHPDDYGYYQHISRKYEYQYNNAETDQQKKTALNKMKSLVRNAKKGTPAPNDW